VNGTAAVCGLQKTGRASDPGSLVNGTSRADFEFWAAGSNRNVLVGPYCPVRHRRKRRNWLDGVLL